VKICFVCMGNICRSPTAEGIMQAKVDAADPGRSNGTASAVELDSAGTGGWHRGERADERARAEAHRRGIALTSRARQVHAGDFAYFDLLVAMDRANHADLLDLAPDAAARAKVRLLREFSSGASDAGRAFPIDLDDPSLDVPDPYYGGPNGFADVFDLIDDACDGLLAHVLDHDAEPVPSATPDASVEGQETPGA
jgi:protein-tyrosine phosphatase